MTHRRNSRYKGPNATKLGPNRPAINFPRTSTQSSISSLLLRVINTFHRILRYGAFDLNAIICIRTLPGIRGFRFQVDWQSLISWNGWIIGRVSVRKKNWNFSFFFLFFFFFYQGKLTIRRGNLYFSRRKSFCASCNSLCEGEDGEDWRGEEKVGTSSHWNEVRENS